MIKIKTNLKLNKNIYNYNNLSAATKIGGDNYSSFSKNFSEENKPEIFCNGYNETDIIKKDGDDLILSVGYNGDVMSYLDFGTQVRFPYLVPYKESVTSKRRLNNAKSDGVGMKLFFSNPADENGIEAREITELVIENVTDSLIKSIAKMDLI